MIVRYDDREQIEAAQIAANEEAIGQACSRILGVPERDIPELDIWLYIGGACVQGAYCPRDRRDVPDVWDRFVVPTWEERQ